MKVKREELSKGKKFFLFVHFYGLVLLTAYDFTISRKKLHVHFYFGT